MQKKAKIVQLKGIQNSFPIGLCYTLNIYTNQNTCVHMFYSIFDRNGRIFTFDTQKKLNRVLKLRFHAITNQNTRN